MRLIAERRYGELLKHLAKIQGQRNDKLPAAVAAGSPYREAIERDGISERSAERYQALAEVPKAVFDEALRDETSKPAPRKIIDQARDSQPTINPAALCGRISRAARRPLKIESPPHQRQPPMWGSPATVRTLEGCKATQRHTHIGL